MTKKAIHDSSPPYTIFHKISTPITKHTDAFEEFYELSVMKIEIF